jgi:hypothetical protein
MRVTGRIGERIIALASACRVAWHRRRPAWRGYSVEVVAVFSGQTFGAAILIFAGFSGSTATVPPL